MTFTELGDKFITLGKLLNDETATLDQVVTAADEIGFDFRISFLPRSIEATSDEN